MSDTPKRRGRPRREFPTQKESLSPNDLIESIKDDTPSPKEKIQESIRNLMRESVRSESREPTREPVRESSRTGELSSLERARIRAEKILQSGNLSHENDDRTRTPIPPEGWVYEWKLHSVYNHEYKDRQIEHQMKGWEPVPASRHPELMPLGYKGETITIGDGTVLYERPKIVNDFRKGELNQKARDQVSDKEAQLGQTPQNDSDFVQMHRPNLKKSYAPIAATQSSEFQKVMSIPTD